MTTRDHTAERNSRILPPYRGLLAVDAVGFSRQPGAELPELSAGIPDLLERAFADADLDAVWARRRFEQRTGDGFVCGFVPADLPFVVHPFLDRLDEALRRLDIRLRGRDRHLRLRLRVALNVGPVPDAGDERHDRISTPTNDTFRLLDSTVLKHVMAESNPDLTLMAVIVAQRVFEDVIREGWSGLHADQFEQVTAEVAGKGFAQPAWLYVPRPSARRTSGPRSVATADESDAGARGSSVSSTVYGQSINADKISGGIHQDNSGWWARRERS